MKIGVLCKYIVAAMLYSRLMMTISASGGAEDTLVPKRELLLLEEIPIVVVTPARVEQPILESPSTITVLTKEDIRRYGMISFSDILRNVPGMDVMYVSATDRNVSIRGFNQLASGKILSLVDSRPIYLDFYGMTLWEFLPVSLDKIERIEITRGPGSALYGANAFDGVVNIITDPSEADPGTEMSVKLNQSGELSESIIHGGKVDELSYEASLGSERVSGWDDEETDNGRNRRFNGFLQYAIDDKSAISLTAALNDYRGDFSTPTSVLEPSEYDGITNYLEMGYDRSDFRCKALWRRTFWNVEAQTAFPEYQTESNSFDAELQHSFYSLARNFITWGLNYRFNRVDSQILGKQHDQNLLAGYIQDQFRLSRALTLTSGLRYDRHPLTGNNFSPRGSLVYSPAKGHAFRISAGRAFQNPPFLYSYFNVSYKISTQMYPVPVEMKLIGNRELAPEWITSFEFGYQGNFGARLRGGIDIFFNKLDGLATFDVFETHPENSLFSGSPGGVIPSALSIFNSLDADARGGEISLDFSVNRWLSVYGNYSYQRVTDSGTGERLESAPRHKLNPGLCVKPGRGFLASLFANYVDRTVWDSVELDPYTLLNSVISYRRGNTEIALSALNLLNNRHQEHPQGHEVGRSLALRLTYQIQ